jgi:hypothetical protein
MIGECISSPAALDAAISLLERPSGDQSCGDLLATAGRFEIDQ